MDFTVGDDFLGVCSKNNSYECVCPVLNGFGIMTT